MSVLIPAYNSERYIAEALESMLAQTVTDLEVVIVDDGSTDRTCEVVRSFADERVRLIEMPHAGTSAALNTAIEAARGEYLARLDSDDVSTPDRLQKQVAFLEANPDVGVVGSWCTTMDEFGRRTGELRWPVDDLSIRWQCLTGSPFSSPSMLFRRRVLADNNLWFDADCVYAEDYELWTRLVVCTKCANMPEYLTAYRLHSSSVSLAHRDVQLDVHYRASQAMIAAEYPPLGFDATTVRGLVDLLAPDRVQYSVADPERNRHIDAYLRLLAAFARRHSGGQGLRKLVLRESLRALWLMRRKPFAAGWLGVAAGFVRANLGGARE